MVELYVGNNCVVDIEIEEVSVEFASLDYKYVFFGVVVSIGAM